MLEKIEGYGDQIESKSNSLVIKNQLKTVLTLPYWLLIFWKSLFYSLLTEKKKKNFYHKLFKTKKEFLEAHLWHQRFGAIVHSIALFNIPVKDEFFFWSMNLSVFLTIILRNIKKKRFWMLIWKKWF